MLAAYRVISANTPNIVDIIDIARSIKIWKKMREGEKKVSENWRSYFTKFENANANNCIDVVKQDKAVSYSVEYTTKVALISTTDEMKISGKSSAHTAQRVIALDSFVI